MAGRSPATASSWQPRAGASPRRCSKVQAGTGRREPGGGAVCADPTPLLPTPWQGLHAWARGQFEATLGWRAVTRQVGTTRWADAPLPRPPPPHPRAPTSLHLLPPPAPALPHTHTLIPPCRLRLLAARAAAACQGRRQQRAGSTGVCLLHGRVHAGPGGHRRAVRRSGQAAGAQRSAGQGCWVERGQQSPLPHSCVLHVAGGASKMRRAAMLRGLCTCGRPRHRCARKCLCPSCFAALRWARKAGPAGLTPPQRAGTMPLTAAPATPRLSLAHVLLQGRPRRGAARELGVARPCLE